MASGRRIGSPTRRQAVTVDLRGHGESDWAKDGDYRVTSFAGDILAVLARLPTKPVLVGASLGGITSMLLVGEMNPGVARSVVFVDVVPEMDPLGTSRIHAFLTDRLTAGFDSLEEAAEAIGAYDQQRVRPVNLNRLRSNLRRRGKRWYWHWDPRFIDGTAAHPPLEIIDVDRLYAAVAAIVDAGLARTVRSWTNERCRHRSARASVPRQVSRGRIRRR